MTMREIIERNAMRFNRAHQWQNIRQFAVMINNELRDLEGEPDKLVFLYKLRETQVKELEDHKPKCQHPDTCTKESQMLEQMYQIEKAIKELNPALNFKVIQQNVNVDLVKKNLVDLSSFPDIGELYQLALDKLNAGRFQRNLVDDLRLAVEMLLRKVLNNNAPLEKQLVTLGQHLDSKGVSSDVRSMFRELLNFYAKWNNQNVKHDDAVPELEIDLIVNLSSTFISFLLRIR